MMQAWLARGPPGTGNGDSSPRKRTRSFFGNWFPSPDDHSSDEENVSIERGTVAEDEKTGLARKNSKDKVPCSVAGMLGFDSSAISVKTSMKWNRVACDIH